MYALILFLVNPPELPIRGVCLKIKFKHYLHLPSETISPNPYALQPKHVHPTSHRLAVSFLLSLHALPLILPLFLP